MNKLEEMEGMTVDAEGNYHDPPKETIEARRKLHETHAPASLEEKYYELLFAVVMKYEGETRHETALRYIGEGRAREGTFATTAPSPKTKGPE